MHIGINCIDINADYKGGLNTYTLGLLNGFRTAGSRHSFQIYATPKNRVLFDEYRRYPNFEIIDLPYDDSMATMLKKITHELTVFSGSVSLHRGASDRVFRNVADIIDTSSHIVYTPTPTLLPYTQKIPQLLSMHDIQQFHYPQFFTRRDLISRKIKYRASAEAADYLQASSQFIKRDLLEHYDCLKAEQIMVIPEGVAIETFRTVGDWQTVKVKYDLPAEFLYYPAQLWHHKNHITVLKALLAIREKGFLIPLVLTGGPFSAADSIFAFIRANKMEGQVRYLGKVPFEDLVILYQQARYVMSASLHESSCLPVLEAAAAGCPVIASDIAPNREMSQRLAMNLFDPLDEHTLVDLILQLWDDEQVRANQTAHNSKNIGYYSWQKCAERYLDVFENITLDSDSIFF